jgi:hypothetical protein
MTLRIILGIVIIAAVIISGVYIGDYFNKSFAADALASQIQNQDQNLVTLTDQTEKLNKDIANHTVEVDNLLSSIESESNNIPSEKIDPNDIVKDLLELGQRNMVSIIPLSTTDWSGVKTNGSDYQVFKATLEINGSLENITRFVSQTQYLYSTLIIDNISLYQKNPNLAPAVTSADGLIADPVSNTTASLSLAIYIQSLDRRS